MPLEPTSMGERVQEGDQVPPPQKTATPPHPIHFSSSCRLGWSFLRGGTLIQMNVVGRRHPSCPCKTLLPRRRHRRVHRSMNEAIVT